MLKGCHQFHSTHKVGPWTPLTSSPSNVLSAALKTREIGDWLTAVVRWHIRYLLKRISWQWHDQVSEWALRVQTHLLSCMVFRSGGAFIIHCLVSPFVTVHLSPSIHHRSFVTVTHVEHSYACNTIMPHRPCHPHFPPFSHKAPHPSFIISKSVWHMSLQRMHMPWHVQSLLKQELSSWTELLDLHMSRLLSESQP